MDSTRSFLRDLWSLTRPYWHSEERWAARGLLAVIVSLNLGIVYVNVLINKWQNAFYNALQDKDIAAFYRLIAQFAVLAAAYIVAAVYQLYLNQMLQIRWRRWLTDRYLEDWIGSRVYYRMQLTDRGMDNPDQRIADDLAQFVDRTLNLALGLLSAVVTLASFTAILWSLSGAFDLTVGGVEIRIAGYMVWVALLYAVAGTWLTHWIGRPLIALNFNQQRVEANFRFSLVRFRENAESIAIHRGEAGEIGSLRRRFAEVAENWWAIMRRQKKLTWLRSGYGQIAVIFPYLVAAPRYFSGAIPLGGLMQTGSAFGQVQESLSWFVSAYVQLADWKATVDRLTGFRRAASEAQADAAERPGIAYEEADSNLAAAAVSLDRPDGSALLAPFSVEVAPGDSVLLTGPSGSGKSTLMRAFARIWPFGHGRLRVPRDAVLFLPQRPYLTIGTLREQLSYPNPAAAHAEGELLVALANCGLARLAGELDSERHWAQVLSPGEQQRIAFARALLARPRWLFLDEATSSLDERSEAQLYGMLRERLPGTTIVSIGHRSTLQAFHRRIWRIEPGADGAGALRPAV